jgi:D-alanyl-D-alanine carboxypeptidase
LAISVPGRALWSTEFGEERAGVAMTANVLLGTGSISKMLAAVGALRLVDRGRIALADTAGKWFAGVAGIPSGITVRSMLWHQSGLAEYGSAAGYSAAITANLQRVWQPEDLLGFIGPPVFLQGTAWTASNTDRLLLAIICARTTGLAYGEYLAQEMFNGGEGGFWTPGQTRPPTPRIATHWGVNTAGAPFDYSTAWFGPSLFTSRLETYLTARETALFARRMFDGDLLSPAGRQQLLTFFQDDGRIAGQTGGGVGIRRFEYFGRTMYGNSGATSNSSAMYLYDPQTKVIVAMSTNQEGGMHGNSHFRTVPALVKAVNDWLASGG